MSDFRTALTAAGLRPREIVADGKWRRCSTDDKPRKRNGAYKLDTDGLGWFRNWACHDTPQRWSDGTVLRHDPQAERRIAAARERERKSRILSMRGARTYWNGSRPLNRPHPYLERKGLSPFGCAGLRQHDDQLVVPVWHGEWLISVQKISIDGDKRFWPGAPVKAGAFVIERKGAAVTAIVEGLATGLAVFQSVRHARVIVAFDAGNLLPVVQRLKPSGSVVICADNDWKTQARRGMNPGIEKARNAAELIGAGVAYTEGIEGSDWADALKEWGLLASRRIERLILGRAKFVEAMPP